MWNPLISRCSRRRMIAGPDRARDSACPICRKLRASSAPHAVCVVEGDAAPVGFENTAAFARHQRLEQPVSGLLPLIIEAGNRGARFRLDRLAQSQKLWPGLWKR